MPDRESPGAAPLAVGAAVPDYSLWPERPKRRDPAHVVTDISYTPDNGPCWSECKCGAVFAADDPEAMAEAWDRHRGKGIVPNARTSPPMPKCRVAGCELVAPCVVHDGYDPQAGTAYAGWKLR